MKFFIISLTKIFSMTPFHQTTKKKTVQLLRLFFAMNIFLFTTIQAFSSTPLQAVGDTLEESKTEYLHCSLGETLPP